VGKQLTVWPHIEHTARYPSGRPLDGGAQSEPIASHTFEFRVMQDDLTTRLSGARTPKGDERWERLIAVPHLIHGVEMAYGGSGMPYVVPARLDVLELTDRVRQEGGRSWWDWFDQAGDDELGEIAHTIAKHDDDGEYGLALIGGAAYYFTDLDVHPAFRGQHLGARLLAHATWLLVCECDNIGLLRASPKVHGLFDPPREGTNEPDAVPIEQHHALTRYYERVGYRRWKPGSRLMYFLGDWPEPWGRRR
jgi:GNAT superfamily N-acetyltransferase